MWKKDKYCHYSGLPSPAAYEKRGINYITTQIKIKMKKLIKFWDDYYPIVLAFISFLYSVTLWFTGNKLEGIFVGIWVPSILALSIAIRQRRDRK